MNRWLRRLVILLILTLWLILLAFPAVAFILATRDQIQVGDDPAQHLRLFLVSEPQAQGVGIERARRLKNPNGCSQTNVAFLMWEGESESIVYCQCFDEGGGVVVSQTSACADE